MFYYYGAKNQLARYYPEPKHNLIIEPFSGSAAYGLFHLKKNNKIKLFLVEKDTRVFNAWKFLLTCSPEDIINYPVPKIGEMTQDFLIMTTSVSNATSKCLNMKYTERLEKVFSIQKRKILKLLSLRDRIEILNDSYENLNNARATWFIDPPYTITKSSNPKTLFSNGNGYSKECGADQLSYTVLASFCKTRFGQVIVCEKEGADWLPFIAFKNGKSSLGRNYKEVIWTNK